MRKKKLLQFQNPNIRTNSIATKQQAIALNSIPYWRRDQYMEENFYSKNIGDLDEAADNLWRLAALMREFGRDNVTTHIYIME